MGVRKVGDREVLFRREEGIGLFPRCSGGFLLFPRFVLAPETGQDPDEEPHAVIFNKSVFRGSRQERSR